MGSGVVICQVVLKKKVEAKEKLKKNFGSWFRMDFSSQCAK